MAVHEHAHQLVCAGRKVRHHTSVGGTVRKVLHAVLAELHTVGEKTVVRQVQLLIVANCLLLCVSLLIQGTRKGPPDAVASVVLSASWELPPVVYR